ncbi:RICIN domain-containing protein [Actinomadura sp. 3N407]|uniref:RICIN domain-containing protein n=1 Tax=Actinomadura sp. 3N407 TaxID=3457423 RepID=UPI003FCD2C3C
MSALSLTGLLAGTGAVATPAHADDSTSRLARQVPLEPVKIRNVANQGALVPYEAGTAPGTPVVMTKVWPRGQEWQFEPAGSYHGVFTYKIENINAAGMCLTVIEPLPPDNFFYDTEIQPCTAPVNDSQQWILRQALNDRHAYQIINADHLRRGLVPYTTATHHTGVKLRPLNNTTAFSWRLELQ